MGLKNLSHTKHFLVRYEGLSFYFVKSKYTCLVKPIKKIYYKSTHIVLGHFHQFNNLLQVDNLCAKIVLFLYKYFKENLWKNLVFSVKPVFIVLNVFSHIKNSPLFWHENFEKGKYKNYVLILENKKWFIFVISTFKSLFIFKFQHHPISF